MQLCGLCRPALAQPTCVRLDGGHGGLDAQRDRPFAPGDRRKWPRRLDVHSELAARVLDLGPVDGRRLEMCDPRPADDEPRGNRAHLCIKPQGANASPNTHRKGQRGLSGTTAGGTWVEDGQTGAANGGARYQQWHGPAEVLVRRGGAWDRTAEGVHPDAAVTPIPGSGRKGDVTDQRVTLSATEVTSGTDPHLGKVTFDPVVGTVRMTFRVTSVRSMDTVAMTEP